MAKQTTRLDLLIVERGLLPSRQAAQAAIMDGGILVDGQKVTKPGTPVSPQAKIELTNQWQGTKFVSRGGFKLERALDQFRIDVNNRICLDVGASTGGFTDCLLQRGAQLVYAIDVGYGQLEWKLRQDPRVVVRERVNARHLTPEELYADAAEHADFAVFDLSFISLSKVVPSCLNLLTARSELVALVKPQFEAGKDAVGKGGVVREAKTHADVLQHTVAFAQAAGLITCAITHSPIKGPAGNIEFLIHWQRENDQRLALDVDLDIEAIVANAHEELSGSPTETAKE
jgi:23S rRNA (cytidine1920-2'-O)/16S rRNA (cytidine1409-2'-O)-methyltransferase